MTLGTMPHGCSRPRRADLACKPDSCELSVQPVTYGFGFEPVAGSSYSAALVFLLAAAHSGDVSGVVAFSPGEYLADTNAVRAAVRRVNVPVYIDPSTADEAAASAAILKAVNSPNKQQ